MTVLGESVYEGETFALRFRFNDNYPLEAPEVIFLTSPPYKAPEVCNRKKKEKFKIVSELLTLKLFNSILTFTLMDIVVFPSCQPNGVQYST